MGDCGGGAAPAAPSKYAPAMQSSLQLMFHETVIRTGILVCHTKFITLGKSVQEFKTTNEIDGLC